MNLFFSKRAYLAILAIAFVGLFSACASKQVQPDYDTSVDFSQFKTYHWNDRAELKKYHARNPFVHSVIVEEVDKDLAANGYQKSASDKKADLLLDYQMSIEARQSSSRTSIGFGTGSYSRGSSVGVGVTMPLGGVQTENEITLIVQIADPKTSKTIWRAVGVESFSGSTTGSNIKSLMRTLTEKIMAEYPPKK